MRDSSTQLLGAVILTCNAQIQPVEWKLSIHLR